MLIRFVIDNFFSFGSVKEFNMLPKPKYRILDHHKYKVKNFSLLKMTSIYGANGSGKSNLVKSLEILQKIVTKEELPANLTSTVFKFHAKKESLTQTLAIEFIQDNIPFYYGLRISDGIILTEELYKSGLGKKPDEIIFERNSINKETKIKFLEVFEKDAESKVLKNVIEKNLAKPEKSILKLLTTLDNLFLEDTKTALKWFNESLQIISPDSKPSALAHRIDKDDVFKKYAEDIMCSFNIGISKIKSEKKKFDDFFGEDNDADELKELLKRLEESPVKMLGLRSKSGDEIVLVEENGNVYAKQLKLEHSGEDGRSASFDLNEESDGTVRLLDFIPAFNDVVSKTRVFVIDEIERSIHPLLIKELIRKFSADKNTKGQLIFTTHESNLLDQNIFRQDEIWFAEKDKNGSTDLYSLSDFKEHNTIDIRKGYLNGRYGSIPFLASLKDLNWHNYDTQNSSISKRRTK